ncbi:MAG: glycosyltransferase [Methylobacter sp.]|jgi:glycosyltransferase involved in cell wall biosynthesis|nr:glycosyltransferase [Methylobacter sp.]
MAKLFIHATNVHQGGGKTLLDALIKGCVAHQECVLLLDSRMPVPGIPMDHVQIKRVHPSVPQRFLAEWWLAKQVCGEDTVLCFGNLPPLFKLAGWVVVFVQNKYLAEDASLSGFAMKTRLRLNIERLWLSWKAGNANAFVVQTPAMKAALESRFCNRTKTGIRMLPFVDGMKGYQRNLATQRSREPKDFDFLYMASGEPHKNHRRLIEGWCLLAEEGLFPSLCLTLDKSRFAGLCDWIAEKKIQYGLHVENFGMVPHDQGKQFYQSGGALVYPSVFESFGLPLIEARQAGLPVLASELDYVRDVLDPEQTFDPESAISIARAVKRFMGGDERPLPLLDAAEFIGQILKKVE